jgi:type 2 lantibiotic biosynthesis protein LanM
MYDLPSNFIERVATLEEVLGPDFSTVPSSESASEQDDAFWSRWNYLAANGDQNRFLQRIKWAGWNEKECKSRLRGFRRIPDLPLPNWAIRAQVLLRILNNKAGASADFAINTQSSDFPFIELINPVLLQSQSSLKIQLMTCGFSKHHAEALSIHAMKSLQQELVDLLGPVLFSMFQQHRAQCKSEINGRRAYLKFVDRMQLGGYLQLFEARPVLLRLLVKVCDQWLTTSKEFLLRLRDDLAMVSEFVLAHYPVRLKLDDVKEFQFGLSDPHNGGRSVIIIELQNQQKFVYKPKDLQAEVNLSQMLKILRSASPILDLRLPRCLAKNEYGWMEFIENTACKDRKHIESYYMRAGAWLALFHILDGSDIHDENLIACGEHPIPIDFEVLFQGGEKIEYTDDAFHLAREKIRHTVLAVGMLPTYGRDHNKLSFESGGLLEGKTSVKTLEWKNLNTDSMTLDIKEIERINQSNLPRIGETIQKASDFQEAIIFGFEACMNQILKMRESTEMAKTLEKFKYLSFRKVYRPTYFYYFMLERLRDFRVWRNGLAWSIEAEFMYRLVDWDSTSTHRLPSIAKAETQALLELNIPHFSNKADEASVTSCDDVEINSNGMDGFTLVCNRLSILSTQDIQRESNLIRLAFGNSNFAKNAKFNSINTKVSDLDSPINIAEFIAAQAIRHRGSAAWLGLDWNADLDKSQLVVLGQDFYNGNGGIAIFLAAAAKLLNRPGLRELAYEAVAQLRANTKKVNGEIIAQRNEIGGATGLTSHVYVLTTLSALLEDESLLVDASKLVKQLSREVIASDKTFDVLAGSAGAILALIKYYESHKEYIGLEMAIACGDHLLSQEQEWRNIVDTRQPITNIQANGFAHGAAGISLALFRLAQVSGQVFYRNAAHNFVQFENASFSSSANNWPDLRFRHLPESTWACQWCHGAGGIGLARLCALETIPTKDETLDLLMRDVDRALKGVFSIDWPGPIDSLCCGNAGNTEFLREAGVRLRRPLLTLKANEMLDAAINRMRTEGDFSWSTGDAQFNLGLFRGLSGLGYAMLRASYPNTLPNILIWE